MQTPAENPRQAVDQDTAWPKPAPLSIASLVTLIALPNGYALLPLAQSREATAAWLGLGLTKVQQLMNAGELETAKVDGRTLILTRSTIALIERNLVRRAS